MTERMGYGLVMMIIPDYPRFCALTLQMRPILHPLFQQLAEGISEFTFANLYLFRHTHRYQISRFSDVHYIISGQDGADTFFLLPFGWAEPHFLAKFFDEFEAMKCVSESQAEHLSAMGYQAAEDRDSFDYLYSQKELAELTGRKFHKKRNLIKAFLNNYAYEGKPLLEEYIPDALAILDAWQEGRTDDGDYAAAKEALEYAEELQLCGGLYYVEGKPVAYSLGEELAQGSSFVVHFEKAVGDYKGIWQFVNQAFASILPDKYRMINREQDLGDSGLRQAKLSYRPVGFVKKFCVTPS
jgi:hypothetical protein